MPPPTSDHSFESSLADMATAAVMDRLPSIAEYLVGLQLLDADEDQTWAIAVLGAKIGEDRWLYLPIIYRQGEILGRELTYAVNEDLFFPSDEAWLLSFMSKARFQLGQKSDRTVSEIQRYQGSDLFRMRRSPLTSKYAADGQAKAAADHLFQPDYFARAGTRVIPCSFDHKSAAAKATLKHMFGKLADARYTKSASRADVVNQLNELGPARARQVLGHITSQPKFAQALTRFYGRDRLHEIDLASDAKVASLKQSIYEIEREKVHILKGMDIPTLPKSVPLSDKDRRALLQGNVIVKDQRDNTSYTILRSPDLKIGQTIESGVCEVLNCYGKTVRVLVLDLRDRESGQKIVQTRHDSVNDLWGGPEHGRNLRDMGSQRRTPRLVIPLDSDEYKGYFETERPFLVTRTFNDWFTIGDKHKIFKSTDGLKAGMDVVIAYADGSTDGGARVLSVEDNGDDNVAIELKRHSCANSLFIDGKEEPDLTLNLGIHATQAPHRLTTANGKAVVLVNRYATRFVPIEEQKKEDDGKYLKFHSALEILTPDAMDLLIHNRLSGDILKIQSDGGRYVLSDSTDGQTKSASLSPIETLSMLTRNIGIHGDAAMDMLKMADEHGRATWYVRRADAYKSAGLEDLIHDTVNLPSLGQANIDAMQRDDLTGRQQSQQTSLQIQSGNFGNSRQGRPDTVYNQSPQAQSPVPLDFTDTLSKTKQKELFDVGVLATLAKADNVERKIDEFLPDILLGMDRIGRLYFLYLCKPEAFKDVYSESDMQDLKEQLVQTFESVGQTAMFLKRKWETASRTEGAASTLIGV